MSALCGCFGGPKHKGNKPAPKDSKGRSSWASSNQPPLHENEVTQDEIIFTELQFLNRFASLEMAQLILNFIVEFYASLLKLCSLGFNFRGFLFRFQSRKN